MKKAKKYLSDCFEAIETYLGKFQKGHDGEMLHQYRVSVKKLKAVYPLIEFDNNDFNAKKSFRLHSKLFRLSGKIRDREMILRTAKKYGIDFLHIVSIPDEIKKKEEVATFCKRADKYITRLSKTSKDLKEYTDSISRKSLRKYLASCEKDIIHKLNSNPEKENLHIARKKIKAVLYLSKLDIDFDTRLTSVLTELEKEIGNLHDKEILVNALRLSSSKSIVQKLKNEQAHDIATIKSLKNKLSRILK